MLTYFFKSTEKINDFWTSFDVKKFHRSLNELYLSILAKSNTNCQYELENIDQVTIAKPSK